MADTTSASNYTATWLLKLTQWDICIRRYSIPLILGIFVSIIHANVSPSSYTNFFEYKLIPITDNLAITFEFLINDIFMMYFFGFIMKHIIQSLTPPNGTMYPLKRAISPIISSFCGIITPIILYIIFISIFTRFSSKYSLNTLLNGWAIPMSTDVALSWTVATFIFNDNLNNATTSNFYLHEIHPCISFLLLLSICDDIIGLIIIGIFYKPDELKINLIWILLILFAILLSAISNKYFKIYYWWYYIFIMGTISWFGFITSGIHPALSLIVIMPFMLFKKQNNNNYKLNIRSFRCCCCRNNNDHEKQELIKDTKNTINYNYYSLDMLNKFERRIDRFVEYGLFFFTYCNAGVQFNDFGAITFFIFFSLLIGKIIGISFGSFTINKLFNIPLPAKMKLNQLPLIGFCGSISLIVSLFISDIAFDDNQLIDQSKMGVLCGAIFGMIAALSYRFVYKRNNLSNQQIIDAIQDEQTNKSVPVHDAHAEMTSSLKYIE